jgi:hypothetical protein
MWAIRQRRNENFNTQYTLPSHAEQTVFGTREQKDPNQTSELITDSDEPLCDVVVMKDGEHCEEVFLEPYLRSKSGYTACSNTQWPLRPDSCCTSQEADSVQFGPEPQIQRPPNSRRHCPPTFRGPKSKE